MKDRKIDKGMRGNRLGNKNTGLVSSRPYHFIFSRLNNSRSAMIPFDLWNRIIHALPLGYRIPHPEFEKLLMVEPLPKRQPRGMPVVKRRRRK